MKYKRYAESKVYTDSPLNTDPYGPHMKCIALIGTNKRVLDVGCLTGSVSQKLKENGCYVVGIELDSECAKLAERHCDKVIVGNVESIALDYNEYFDVILFADILEHLRNPQEVIKRFRKYLKKDGYIVASIPNVAYWSNRLLLLRGEFGPDDQLLAPDHLKFFTERTVREMIQDAGFKIVHFDITLKGKFTAFRLVRFISKLWKNLFGYQFIIKAVKI